MLKAAPANGSYSQGLVAGPNSCNFNLQPWGKDEFISGDYMLQTPQVYGTLALLLQDDGYVYFPRVSRKYYEVLWLFNRCGELQW